MSHNIPTTMSLLFLSEISILYQAYGEKEKKNESPREARQMDKQLKKGITKLVLLEILGLILIRIKITSKWVQPFWNA